MPVAELIETLEKKGLTVNQAHKVLKDCGISQSGDVTSEERDRVLAYATNPKPQSQPKEGLALKERQSQARGSLASATQNVGATAVASTAKQMRQIANVAAVEGVVAFGDQMATNLNAIAEQIDASSGKAMEIINAVDAEFALGDEDSPLSLPVSAFSLL